MRKNVMFKSKEMYCAGWLYLPDDLPKGQKAPAIVMAHGFSAVKEMYLPNFAERFVNVGFVVLVFDFRYLGESQGEPRGHIIWHEQIEDYRNAITWVSDQPEVDPNRIGIWGTSFSGAHVLYVAAYDKRVKAVVSQVNGGVNIWDVIMAQMGTEGIAQYLNFLTQDRILRYKTGTINYMKVIAPEGEPSVFNNPEASEWFMEAHKKMAPSWLNQITIESMEKTLEYDLTNVISHISSTPLLMVLAEYDSLIPIHLAKRSYERALEPKAISILPCSHFDVYYKEPWFSKAAEAAKDWFKKHLG